VAVSFAPCLSRKRRLSARESCLSVRLRPTCACTLTASPLRGSPQVKRESLDSVVIGIPRAVSWETQVLEFIAGFLMGVLTNIFSWWILSHWVVPRLRFSPAISKTPRQPTQDDKSGYKYRIKFENAGRRPIIDVELMARLRIKGLGEHPKTNWQIVYIPLDGSVVYRIPRIVPVGRGRHTRHILGFYVNSVDEFRNNPIYPPEIRYKAQERVLLLEDLLTLGTEADLEVEAFGYDEFSGARKLFLPKRYTVHDIKEGYFDTKGLDVHELPSFQQDQGTDTDE